MDIVKRFGLWIIGAAIITAAVGFYLFAVRKVATEHKAMVSSLEERREKLKEWASRPDRIPNDAWIEAAQKIGERITAQLDDCALYLARQPRRAHTRSFFEDERYGQGKEIDASIPNHWLAAYNQHNKELEEQLKEAGITGFQIQTLSGRWGTGVPTAEDIAMAMELYWYQKDLADFLTEQVEKDFADYIKFLSDKPDAFPVKPSDLVINRRPPRLDEFLRALRKDQLVAVLSDILINSRELDLAMVFNMHLPKEFPWDRPPAEQDKPSVLGLTMDEAQRKFLESLVPPDKPDLFNRQRFVDFVHEMRTVRYRSDVVGLLESRGFDDIAVSIRRGTEEEYARALKEISDWSPTKLAQAIAAVVSIKDDKDYRLIYENHRHGIVELASLTIKHAVSAAAAGPGYSDTEGPGRRGPSVTPAAPSAPAPGTTELYKPSSFNMKVKLEFERIPVFLRRLLSNSWRYRVQILSVVPAESGVRTGVETPAPITSRFGPAMLGPGAPAPVEPTRPEKTPKSDADVIEVRNYVWVELVGEAYQFTPLYEKLRDKLGERAPAAARTGAAEAATPSGPR